MSLGIAFPPREERLARLEAFCWALPALWRGERVTDQVLALREASIGPVEVQPPRISIGGASDELLALIARACDGWNFAQSPDPARYAALVRKLEDAWAHQGRAGSPHKAVQIPVDEVDPQDARRLADGFAAVGVDALTFLFTRERSLVTSDRTTHTFMMGTEPIRGERGKRRIWVTHSEETDATRGHATPTPTPCSPR